MTMPDLSISMVYMIFAVSALIMILIPTLVFKHNSKAKVKAKSKPKPKPETYIDTEKEIEKRLQMLREGEL